MHKAKIYCCLGLIGFLASIYPDDPSTGEATFPKISLEITLSDLAKKITGAVISQCGDSIYKTVIGDEKLILLKQQGRYPRWSPDGRYIAYLQGNDIKRMRSDGTESETLASATKARAVAYHPNGDEILFIDGMSIRSVNIDNGQIDTLGSGQNFMELDATMDGRQIAATIRENRGGYRVHAFDMLAGKNWPLGRGCSAGISADGKLVSRLLDGHQELLLVDWQSGKRIAHLTPPANEKFDNHAWSNHANWLVSESEIRGHDIYIHEVSSNSYTRVTHHGDCHRPDLFIETLY